MNLQLGQSFSRWDGMGWKAVLCLANLKPKLVVTIDEASQEQYS
jgi:hypothetical protein